MRDAALLLGLGEAAGKQALRDKEQANTSASDDSKRVRAEYNKILRACNAIDHDDQIAIACDILESHPDVLDAYQGIARHLLVDEYQDINADQHRLIKLLTAGQEAGLFAVGDDDQSVYQFRGGDPRYIRTFHEDYPKAQVLQLQVSRRCLKNILDCALSVVEKYDPDRVQKAEPGYTEVDPGLVRIWNCPSDPREAELIAKAIYAKKAAGEARDFFVLVPNRNYVKTIAQALNAHGVDHDLGTASESNAEWDTLSTLKTFLDTRSNLITRHVIELILAAGTTSMPGERVKKSEKLAARAAFATVIAKLWEPVIAGSSDLITTLANAANADENAKEVYDLIAGVEEAHQSDEIPAYLESVARAFNIFPTIGSFYKCLKFLQDTPGGFGATKSDVRILTFQSSKGLEADCVFIVGLEEGTLPRSLADADGTAEEARLVFVAMTRAKKELHLSHVRTRTGASTYKPVSHQLKASAFVTCLPGKQCEKQYVQSATAAKKGKKLAKR
jgi:DNA helicase II / ATP-dependent DNA helicase PcrA